MTRELLWEINPGEHRLALIENGELVEFRLLRTVGRFASTGAGDIRGARITGRPGAGKALVELDDGSEALLDCAPMVAEGTRLAVEICRPPIPEPGRWKRAICKARDDVRVADTAARDQPAIGTIIARYAMAADCIIVSDQHAWTELTGRMGGADVPIRIDAAAFSGTDFDQLESIAITGEVAIANGQLSIERTRAMALIDIDGSGDPLALNLAAALEIPRLLRLFDIGGQIGIDFLAMPDRKARQRLDTVLAEAGEMLGPHERTAANGFGFVQMVRPRFGPSIAELLCGITPGRLSLESRAIALLRVASRSTGFGPRRIVAAPAITDLMRQWPAELAGLQKRLGAEIELVPDSSASGYGHVHVSQS